MKLNSYLNFDGNCEEALNFYAQLFGAKVLMMMRYSDTPMAGDCGKGMENKVAHGRIALGEDILMASDVPAGRYVKPAGFNMNVGVATPEEAEKVFKALSEKGTVTMPLAETFWALRFGMTTDRFGISWMVNCEKQQG